SSIMDQQPVVPHVVFLPFLTLVHVKPMPMLADLLSHAAFQITFVDSIQIQDHLEPSTNLATQCIVASLRLCLFRRKQVS
ncbi:unnamed protein product, partial [Dovyalis caffra]